MHSQQRDIHITLDGEHSVICGMWNQIQRKRTVSSHLDLRQHNLEPIKIIEWGSSFLHNELPAPGTVLPFVLHICHSQNQWIKHIMKKWAKKVILHGFGFDKTHQQPPLPESMSSSSEPSWCQPWYLSARASWSSLGSWPYQGHRQEPTDGEEDSLYCQ